MPETTTPTPYATLPPTMRVAVELTFVRACEECRAIAERTTIAAIHDGSVNSLRVVPGSKHAHEVKGESAMLGNPGTGSDASSGQPRAENLLFDGIPRSDTNGFDPQGRD